MGGGESGKSGREKQEESRNIGRRLVGMKLILKAVLLNIVLFLAIASWVTVSSGWELPIGGGTKPIGDQLILVSMDIPLTWRLSADAEYWATVKFDAGFKPEIRRGCFNFSGAGQFCVDVKAQDVTSGHFRVPIHVPVGTKRIKCYAEYIRDGQTQQTNTITYHVITLKSSEE